MVVSDTPDFPRVHDHLLLPEPHDPPIRSHLMPDPDPPSEPPHTPPSPDPSTLAQGLAKGIVALCDVLEIPLDRHRMSQLDRLDASALEALLERVRANHRWP